MSTRSYIAKTSNTKDSYDESLTPIDYIYCHFDGYVLGGVGERLLNNYSEPGDIDKIFKNGDISSLPSDPDDVIEQAYYENGSVGKIDNEYCFMQDLSGDIFIEYVYLYKDDKWNVSYLIMDTKDEDCYFGYKPYHTKFKDLKEEYKRLKENEYLTNKEFS